MILVGGEQESPNLGYYRSLTSSGRDSLRLIIESGNLHDRVFVIPDFLCDVIIQTLNAYHIKYRFYKVQQDFSLQLGPLDSEEVVYIIKYFGHQQDIIETLSANTVIVDDVFSPFPERLSTHTRCWYSFNSLRKISPLVDGSLVYSSHPLDEQRIQLAASTEFSRQKSWAKNKKFDFIHHEIGNEQEYLELFATAEQLLNTRHSISGMSIGSQIAFAEFCAHLAHEKKIRQQNYRIIGHWLPEEIIPLKTEFYSFAPLLLTNRDAIKAHLMRHQIFLPIHWPHGSSIMNQHILSIPVDGRYTQQELDVVCQHIRAFL